MASYRQSGKANGSEARPSRRADDVSLREFIDESREYRKLMTEMQEAQNKKIDATARVQEEQAAQLRCLAKSFKKYEPFLEAAVDESDWWKKTMLEAKRKGVITILGVFTVAALGGFWLGIHKYWNKLFPWL